MFVQFIFIVIMISLLTKVLLSKVSGDQEVNLPPGPQQYPIIGNLLHWISAGKSGNNAIFHVLKQLNDQYGPVVYLKIGALKNVVLGDIETIKECMASDIWVNRFYDDWLAERSFGKTLGVLMVSGPVWKEMRRFTIRTLREFGFGKHQSMESTVQHELEELTSSLQKKLSNKDNAGVIVNMKQYFTISVLNILWVMLAGTRFSHQDKALRKLLHLMDLSVRANAIGSAECTLISAFPFLAPILPKFLKQGKHRHEFIAGIHKFFRDILNERRTEGTYKHEQRDFIDVFLQKIDSHSKKSPESNMYTDEQFIVVAFDLFLAGSETTSNTMEFAILYMILHPDVQKKVQSEIDSIIGRSRFPSILDKASMPYTEATLLEIQRMACVLPLNIRSPNQDTRIGKYFIPKGTTGIINLYGLHMNEKVFEDPHKFKPERFLDSQNRIINSSQILPFGFGRRSCLGETLAKTTLFTFFTTYLQNFTMEKSPDHPEPTMTPVLGFTLAPESYHALIKIRDNSNIG